LHNGQGEDEEHHTNVTPHSQEVFLEQGSNFSTCCELKRKNQKFIEGHQDGEVVATHITNINAAIITIHGRLALTWRWEGGSASIKLN
jgi:hypothetical protein